MQYEQAERHILSKLAKELPSNLYYHGLHHTIDVISSVERLAEMEKVSPEELLILKTTALFHDTGFIYQYYNNEHLGVKLACDILPSYGYSGAQITAISKLILATSLPTNPKNQMERIICDADLDYLGRDDFYSVSYTLRREWAEYGKPKTLLQWYEEQLKFMRKHSYFTDAAVKMREQKKQQYVTEMAEMLGKRKKKKATEENGSAVAGNERIQTLRSLSIFSGTSNDVLNGIASAMKTVVVKSGEFIIRKGDIGNCMYIIHSGRVKVHDDIYTIAELGEGNFFGEVSLLDTEPRSASVTAIADTVVFSLEQEDFYKILQKHRDVAQGIIKILIARFRKQNADIFNGLREKEKKLQSLVDQRTIELQNANKEIERALRLIEDKNLKLEAAYKDIQDSISYAKRIQQAILPSVQDVYRALKDSFIYYKPKDIVSGDFYFFAEKNKKVMIGVADCTGHGVPGAFMSMIGHDMLNQIIIEKGITSPSDVLNHLESGIRTALKQDLESSENKDGMDIALCSLDMEQDKGANIELQYAGAFRNLYLVRKDGKEVEEVRADRNSIGGIVSGDIKKFSNHQLYLNKGDTFYIFSDGYCDQFGGPGGKKFMSRQFQKLLLSMKNLPMREQEQVLDKTFLEWKGNLEQVDDILVIGVRV